MNWKQLRDLGYLEIHPFPATDWCHPNCVQSLTLAETGRRLHSSYVSDLQVCPLSGTAHYRHRFAPTQCTYFYWFLNKQFNYKKSIKSILTDFSTNGFSSLVLRFQFNEVPEHHFPFPNGFWPAGHDMTQIHSIIIIITIKQMNWRQFVFKT